jgi:pimeloyl-ACP methyl ester carboxylesterase
MSATLSYVRRGSGTPLILVHGYLGASQMWHRQLDHFSKRFDVIAPALAGFGASAHLTAPETIDGHARLLLSFLDDLGIATFDLMGHSMGGMIVQQMAAEAPDRIGALVLYGTGPMGVLPDRFESIETSRRRIHTDGLAATARRIAATWFLQGEAASEFETCLQAGMQASLQAALASLSAWEHWNGLANLRRITADTLVLWGDRDRSYGWQQPESLWRNIAGASLAVVPGAAHNVHLEKPALFNAIVEDFLGSRPRRLDPVVAGA